MRIALPYDDGRINGHFGHCEGFEIYTVEEGKITGKMLLPTSGSGHKYMTSLMQKMKVDVVLAGGMGKAAIDLLLAMNIDLYLGLSGTTDEFVQLCLDGKLEDHNVKNMDISKLAHSCGCHD